MTIQDLGSIGEFVAAIATIATLIYLAIQIRQNTETVRSSTHQQQVDTTVAIHTNVSNDPEMAKLITRANADFESLEESEQLQLLYFYTNYFNIWHFQYTNMKKGIFDAHAWTVWDEGWLKLLYMQTGMREAWATMGDLYGDEFAAHIQKHLDSAGEGARHTGAMKGLLERNSS